MAYKGVINDEVGIPICPGLLSSLHHTYYLKYPISLLLHTLR